MLIKVEGNLDCGVAQTHDGGLYDIVIPEPVTCLMLLKGTQVENIEATIFSNRNTDIRGPSSE